MILTSYFTSKPHPQAIDPSVFGLNKDGTVWKNSFFYMEEWYNSVRKFNLPAVVFHDGLHEDFISEFQTENIQFKLVDDPKWLSLSLNDARFFYYYEYLTSLEERPEWVFMTDISDVEIISDPRSIDFSKYEFFAGDEDIKLRNYILSFMRGSYFDAHQLFNWACYDEFQEADYELLNAGILGGSTQNVINFLSFFCTERLRIGSFQYNVNMPLANFVLRLLYRDSILHGANLNTRYKKFEDHRKNVIFKHK